MYLKYYRKITFVKVLYFFVKFLKIIYSLNDFKVPIGGCPNSDIDLTENQYLIKLNEVLVSMNSFGPAYLNQPKLDNKIFCS